ncbi:hypothetical protein B0A48_18654 [Cryoendolithus antarcticus]|uniref:Uncharacterized protein n=1 Tax=Cryoendolithus antarcticus TaxID=1507870 RepID=A0A1V8S8X8_9PEZI|nr:hypothetical protein B0A48_18654 [Cryoendolithus antarcticus]
MTPQHSPNVNNNDVAFPQQSYQDGDYDPHQASNFGEVQIINDEFAAIQQAFGGTEKGTGFQTPDESLLVPNNVGGLDQYQQQSLQSQQASDAAGAWPAGGGAAPAFNLSAFHQRGDVRQGMWNNPSLQL